MGETKKKLVKCLVCGAVFEEGIEVCPICGVGPENFIPYEEEEKTYHKNTEEHFLILGNGIAGLSAAEAIRERNSTASIVIASEEEYLTYSRPMLTKSLAGGIVLEDLLIHQPSWYEENHVLTLTGRRAESIDPEKKEVTFTGGIHLKYDKCIYALGSSCFIPPIPGHDRDGVTAIRSLADAKELISRLSGTESAVVIGGGVLGLEAAWELKKAGLSVTVLELAPQLMGRQLDAPAGEFLKNIIQRKGIAIHLNVKIEEIQGEDGVTGVRLGDGTVIPAGLVIVSAGVRANTAAAQTAGAKIGRAVKVNDRMETTVPGLYACGDCAEYEGINYAIWPEAMEMGRAAGANAAGEPLIYKTVAAALTFNGMDTSLFAIGDAGKDPEKNYEVHREEDRQKGTYQATYSVDGVMTGAVLIGDTSRMQEVTEKIGEGK